MPRDPWPSQFQLAVPLPGRRVPRDTPRPRRPLPVEAAVGDRPGPCRRPWNPDRGELERLIDAEAAFNASPRAQAAPPGYRDDYRGQSGYGRYGGDHHRRKRRSFLEELFD